MAEVLAGKTENWNDEEKFGFSEIYKELVYKTQDCIAPLSGAYYSSIMAYQKENSTGKFLIHSGANIDPETKEQLKDPKYRNCAEKQAAISALTIDKETNKDLKVLFLYRKATNHEVFPAEKLIPCKDCHSTYTEDLIANQGKLILVLENSKPRDFLLSTYDKDSVSNLIRSFEGAKGEIINYIIFDAQAMKFLNIEKELGARVCSS